MDSFLRVRQEVERGLGNIHIVVLLNVSTPDNFSQRFHVYAKLHRGQNITNGYHRLTTKLSSRSPSTIFSDCPSRKDWGHCKTVLPIQRWMVTKATEKSSRIS